MNLFGNLASVALSFDTFGVINEFMLPITRHETESNVINFVLNRGLLSIEGNEEMSSAEERLYNNAMRSLRFLTIFTIFSTSFCSLSFYIYNRPFDGPNGNSFVSKIRRLPFFSWFFRQPQFAIEKQSQSSEKIGLMDDNNDMNDLTRDENDIELGNLENDKKGDARSSPMAGTMNQDSINNNNNNNKTGTTPGSQSSSSNNNSNNNNNSKFKSPLLFNSPNLTLFACSLGLLVAYLTWGFTQERIMSHPYGDGSNPDNWFSSSEFCVLINRFFGLLVATVALKFSGRSGKDAPPFVISLCALSNMSSSWFQYESLHFVTFPVQTIFKSSKILITMAVGKIVQKKTFAFRKYATALTVAVGVYIFLDGQKNAKEKDNGDGSSSSSDDDLGIYFYLGLALVSGYALCDAFTSNWQSRVFEQSSISPLEMMQSVNAFTFFVSLCFCLTDLWNILQFYIIHPAIIGHSLIMGVCAGFGQVLIFYTIQQFGAVMFATVMTIRMVISVLLSILYYQHPMSTQGVIGMTLTFAALFYQVYDKSQGKRGEKK